MVIPSAVRRAAASSKKALSNNKSKQSDRYSGPRIELTSAKLCEDVLQRLQPTLPPPGTCDLIDLNPVGATWSKALHNALRPRRHILVGPDPQVLKHSLPNHRYAATLAEAIDPAGDHLTPEFRDKAQAELKCDQSGIPQTQNRYLLITTNLSGRAAKTSHYKGPSAVFGMHTYYNDLVYPPSLYHKYGHTRLLAWVNDDHREAIMPQSVATRGRTGVSLEASMKMVAWARGTAVEELQRRRPYDLDVKNMALVREKEAASGLPGVSSRYPALPPQPLWSDDTSTIDIDQLAERNARLKDMNKLEWVDKLVALDKKLKYQDEELRDRVWEAAQKADRIPGLANDFKTLYTSALFAYRALRKHQKLRQLALSQCEVERDYRSLYRQEISPKSVKQKQELLSRLTSIMNSVRPLSEDHRLSVRKMIDDYRAYDCEPKVLAYSNRAFEPIVADVNEFRPRRAMSLIDVAPNPYYLSTLDTPSKRLCFHFVVVRLFTKPSRSVMEALAGLIHGGLIDFIATVPSLNDPAKVMGPHLEDVRVRSLSTEVLMDIAVAFEKWPFRPAISRMYTVAQHLED